MPKSELRNQTPWLRNRTPKLFYVLPCVILFLCFFFFFFFFFLFFFFSPFSIAITSLVEERAKLSTFRTFVRFLPVWICRFPLPLSVWEELRFVIVTLLGLFSYLFFQFDQAPGLPNCTISQKPLTTVDFFFFFFFFTYTTPIINRH